MRNRLFPAAAAIGLVALACGKLFSITISDEVTTTVQKGTLLEDLTGDLGFGDLVAMDILDAQELQNQGVEPGDVQEVEMVQFDLEATAPEGADLSFLQELELYVEAPDLPRELVASSDDFPEGQALVQLDLTGVDLTPYVVSRSMTLVTEIRGSRPSEDTEVTAIWALRVGVTGQGACNEASGN
jgi:hypothetical protein